VNIDFVGVQRDEVGILVDLEAAYRCQHLLQSTSHLGGMLTQW
jgi:hypothetical protein